ncbi:MAG: SufB/SufD family protein [Candidatus Woesearchaeota archaeon]
MNLENVPEPVYKHGLKIRLTPEINYKDIDSTNATKVETDVEFSKEGNYQEFLFDDKDKQYYSDNIHADKYYLTIPADEAKSLTITTTSVSPGRTAIYVTAKPNSKSEIILINKGSATYDATSLHIIAEEGSYVKIILVQGYESQTHSFKHTGAKIKKDATVEWVAALTGSKYTHASFTNILQEPGAKGTSTVLYLATDNEQYDIDTRSIHKNKETYSNILTRGAVNNNAKALSRGWVRIEKNAFNSNGYEKQDALILSKTAEADAIPNLEIHNHDVKCSHGSTIGQVDELQLFYLMSRGISREDAINTIIKGFFNPILTQLDEKTQDFLNKNISYGL